MTRVGYAAALMLALSGCGDLSYRMGSSGDQFHKDRVTCENSDETAYKACMRARGWTVMDLDSLRPAPATAAATAESLPFAPAGAASDSAKPAAVTPTPPTASAEKPAKAAAAPPPPDPNTVVMVSSWWKFGTTNFKGDTASCTAKLGDAHRYDEVNKTTTRGFAACMRALGWYAY